MPLEKGGRADKFGNRYETKCIIYELLKVLREENYSVTIESLGIDEVGTDILVCKNDRSIEHQQCKVRNASKESWSISDLNSRNIFRAWLKQLSRDNHRTVAIVSPIGCSFLVDLNDRAKNTNEKTEYFYEYQIKGSDPKFIRAYESFCEYMELDCSDPKDVKKSVDYLKRIRFYHLSEEFFRRSNEAMIKFMFSSEYRTVYNEMIRFVVEEDILGKEITAVRLRRYLQEHSINFRSMDNDSIILQRVEMLNKEFSSGFTPWKEVLICRPEFKECINAVENERHLIISGSAGYGKSGCAKAIIDYCEDKLIPHIALKLDRRKPHGNSEIWGKELGFSGSIVYALNSISRNTQAVLLLDQLDALRWTNSNSSEALSVCMELIEQIKNINTTRDKKISIVFVCRSYDLNNDNNIKSLFSNDLEDSYVKGEWEKIDVGLLNEETTSHIVGEYYNDLTSKTKKLLRRASNLYIWTHLNNETLCNDYGTTSSLIREWFKQICQQCAAVGIEEEKLLDTKDKIVKLMDSLGCLFVPRNAINCGERSIGYLVSSEMLIVQGNNIGFIHQSILDYFIAMTMTERYFKCKDIETIIGEKDKQTPSRRYQLQMFMQNLLDYDNSYFLQAGKQLIESEKTRYYIKFVFYEILGQIENPDEAIEEFIVEYCDHELYGKYLLNNVIYGKSQYVGILLHNGVLMKWLEKENHKNIVFRLLESINMNLDLDAIKFIQENAFKKKEDDLRFAECLSHEIINEREELFDLRLQFYRKYPELITSLYVDIKKGFELCEKRIIKLIALLLQSRNKSGKNKLYNIAEIFNDDKNFLVKDGQFILNELLALLPQDKDGMIFYSEWSCRYGYNKHTVERLAVEIIKKANQDVIDKNPKMFWDFYRPYMGKNYAVFNEIILDALRYLPTEFSNDVICFLSTDIDSKIFDRTRNEGNELYLAEEAIKYHTLYCDNECVEALENSIQKYISPRAVEIYKNRIERNREKDTRPVYWSFWGDLQLQLLRSISNDRLSLKSKELLEILERKFEGIPSYYNCGGDGHSGIVVSPVSNRAIGKRQWLQIMKSEKLQKGRHRYWKEVAAGFVESSLEMYVTDFKRAVEIEPSEMIQLVLDNKESIPVCYIDSMLAGAAFSKKQDTVSLEIWEKMFDCFHCDKDRQRAVYFCMIIEKLDIFDWSLDVLKQLKQIANNYMDIEGAEQNFREMDSETLFNKTLNIVSGDVARAIGHLLWEKAELIDIFRDTIEALCTNKNSAIQMASMFALWPTYNFDRDWAEEKIMNLYENDIRMAAFQNSKDMFFLLYHRFGNQVLNIVLKCFASKDKRLIEVGGHALCEFYLLEEEFADTLADVDSFNESQIQSILEMAILYLNNDEYRERAKDIILKCTSSNCNIEYPLSKMFFDSLVDARRDSEFLIEIMNSKVNKRLIYSFVHFLEENAFTLKEFSGVIIALCRNVLNNIEEKEQFWIVGDYISKSIIALYDEYVCAKDQKGKAVAEECLDLWDIMFEKQIGQTRELSRELMER